MRLANQDWDLSLMEGIAAILFMTYLYYWCDKIALILNITK